LVVGANGVIGRNLIDHLITLPDWDVIGVSRRGGESVGRVRYVAADLLNIDDTREKLNSLTEVTHIFYAAYQDRPTWAELVPPNLAMLVNTVEAIEPIAPGLKHVSLMQGYKVYGAHLGPFKTPARETDANHMPPEFNIDQQDFLEQRQKGKAWTWSALRFPGKPGAYDSLLEMTDAGLLAKATVWAATEERCANQAFNITNGDLFRWNELWPKIAHYFGLETAPPLQMSLDVVMADKEQIWNKMVKNHGLARHSYQDVSSWRFGDFVFSWDYDFFADGTKARRLGFHEYVDTEAMFMNIFDDFRKRKVIP
jgi:nucleoside-diphosphate-sugar epimerase